VTSPDTLQWAANLLRTEARHLVPTLEAVLGAFGPTVWSGPAADGVRHELEHERTSLADVALELERIARELDQRAEALRAEAPR
jgi:hypothetical protein